MVKNKTIFLSLFLFLPLNKLTFKKDTNILSQVT